jgi:hypothetical protein
MRNPFVGLRPFRPAENGLFFGRAIETSILRDLALTLPVLTIYAPSGTGKSSLINAGLIPALRRTPDVIDITIADPGLDPYGFVRDQLTGNGWSPGTGLDSLSLAQLLEAHHEDTDHRVILVLDQFEERIKRSDSLDALYAEIAKLANTRSEAATVIISIREDYLAGLDRLMHRVSGLLDAGYRVPPLSRAALTEAVLRPLSIGADVTVEDGLVDLVLDDLEQQARLAGSPERQIEPGHFQIVWHRLWEKAAKAPGSVLTRESYSGEGGAGETGVTAILRSFVGDILSGLLPYEAALLQASLRYLVLPTGAKVALTVPDLVGLLQISDITTGFAELLFLPGRRAETVYTSAGKAERRPEVRPAPRPEVAPILESLFEQLTRTDAPLFRRVRRGAREEFELVHDLMGIILIEWRADYEQRTFAAIRKMRDAAPAPPQDTPSIPAGAQFILRMTSDAGAGRWEAVSDQESSATLRLILSLTNSSGWRYARKSTRQFNELLGLLGELEQKLQPEAVRNPGREVRRALQTDVWELAVMRQNPLYRRESSRLLFWAGLAGFGVLAAGTAAALVTWLAGLMSFLPDVQYLELTVGLAAAGAAILYPAGYDAAAKRTSSGIDRPAARKALWPAPDIPRYSRRPPWVMWPLYFFIWWPVLFGSFVTASYLGAAVFAAFGWSPTAGFNVAALFAGPLLAFAYVIAGDF